MSLYVSVESTHSHNVSKIIKIIDTSLARVDFAYMREKSIYKVKCQKSITS